MALSSRRFRVLSTGGILGVTLLEMMIVVMLIAILAAMIIPNVTESKLQANETSAIASLKTIAAAQAQFREGDTDRDGNLDYSTSIYELSSVGLIDNVLGAGQKSGYLFGLSGSTYDWQATAAPINENTGVRQFFIDLSGTVRFDFYDLPDADSTPIGN